MDVCMCESVYVICFGKLLLIFYSCVLNERKNQGEMHSYLLGVSFPKLRDVVRGVKANCLTGDLDQ